MSKLSNSQLALFKRYKNEFISHPIVETIHSDFDRLRASYLLGGEQECMLLYGDEGSGKSMIAEEYVRKFQNEKVIIDEGKEKLPVLLTKLTEPVTFESFLTHLLIEADGFAEEYRKQKRGRREKLSNKPLEVILKDKLKHLETEIIIIDRAELLLDFDKRMIISNAATKLRSIAQELKIPLVLVGMPQIKRLISASGWRSYINIVRLIPYFKIKDILDRTYYMNVLKGLSTRAQDLFSEVPEFESDEIACPIFALSSGCFKTVRYYINSAVEIALRQHSEIVTIAHFAEVFDRNHEYPLPQKIEDPDPEDDIAKEHNESIDAEVCRRKSINPFNIPTDDLKVDEPIDYATYIYDKNSGTEVHVDTQYLEQLSLSEILKK